MGDGQDGKALARDLRKMLASFGVVRVDVRDAARGDVRLAFRREVPVESREAIIRHAESLARREAAAWEEARRLARDAVTDADGRHSFEALARSLAERGEAYGILLVDLDEFKTVNDRFGHDAGDEALRHVARILRQRTRAGDAVFRIGGDELVVVLRHPDGEAAVRAAAERVRAAVQTTPLTLDPIWDEPRRIEVTITAGGARRRADEDVDELLERVGRELGRGKVLGKNRVVSADDLAAASEPRCMSPLDGDVGILRALATARLEGKATRDVAELAAERLRAAIGARVVTIYERHGDELRPEAVAACAADRSRVRPLRLDEGVVGIAMKDGVTVLVESGHEVRGRDERAVLHPREVRLAVPVPHPGRPGCIDVQRTDGARITSADRRLVESVAVVLPLAAGW